MSFDLSIAALTLALFVAMLALLELGRRLGRRRSAAADGANVGIGAVEGSVFGLMGLMIAFTFAGASTRFEARRQLIVEEANAIGTAWLRLDLLPESDAAAMRERFRAYLDSRLEVYRDVSDSEVRRVNLARSAKLQDEIWAAAVIACREPGMQPATLLVLPALNDMIDITTARTMAGEFHQPMIIFAVLFALALAASLLAGYGMAGATSPRWMHMVAFAAITAIAILVILDLEYPRLGFIRVDASDRVLIELRASMDR
jgi:hypothetical protein